MLVGVPDKVLDKWLNGRNYIACADEGEAVAIGAGAFIATKERSTVFMSMDGFCNALNFITSWIIPEGIEMHLVISTGRQEPPHKVMTDILPDIIKLLPYDTEKLSFEIVEKE